MKLLLVITRAEHGGAQSHVLELLRAFQPRAELALVVGGEAFLTTAARALGVKVFVVPNLVHPIRPVQDLRAVLELRAVIRQFQPDLVHAHSTKAGLVARAAAALERTPAIFTAHGWAFADGINLQRQRVAVLLERVAARYSAAVITVSKADELLALKYRLGLGQRVMTIHNGVESAAPRATPEASAGIPVMVMVARFAEPKDHMLLLEALSGVHQPWRLRFVGDGPCEAAVKQRVATLKLEDRVNFLGTRDDIPDLLADAQVFVLTSKSEGLPISIIEAMRAGLPVIASDVGGVSELVVSDETGFLVARGDVMALRARLETVLSDAGLRARLGAAGRQRFDAHFELEAMLVKTWSVYQITLQARREIR